MYINIYVCIKLFRKVTIFISTTLSEDQKGTNLTIVSLHCPPLRPPPPPGPLCIDTSPKWLTTLSSSQRYEELWSSERLRGGAGRRGGGSHQGFQRGQVLDLVPTEVEVAQAGALGHQDIQTPGDGVVVHLQLRGRERSRHTQVALHTPRSQGGSYCQPQQ